VTPGAVELELGPLRELGRAAYRKAGLTAADADTVVEVQLAADLRGVDTHGFQRLPWYVRHLQQGRNNPTPDYRLLKESPVSVVLDADNALGQLACVRLAELTMAKGREAGLAVGVTRNSNDWGCGAYYPLMAAEQGFVAFATTTSVPTLAPFGGRTRVLGNDPMVYAVPRRSAPAIVLDMALTPVALGTVMRAQAEHQAIPEEWGFLDDQGRPTTDPSAASLFGDGDRFLDEVESMAAQVKASTPLPGAGAVYLPGEPEALRAQEALARGTIGYPPSVVAELEEMAASLGILGPAQVGGRGS